MRERIGRRGRAVHRPALLRGRPGVADPVRRGRSGQRRAVRPVAGSDRLLFDLQGYVLRRLARGRRRAAHGVAATIPMPTRRGSSALAARRSAAGPLRAAALGDRADRLSPAFGVAVAPEPSPPDAVRQGRYAMSPGHVHPPPSSGVRATALPQTGTRGRARARPWRIWPRPSSKPDEEQRRRTLWPFARRSGSTGTTCRARAPACRSSTMGAASKAALHDLLRHALSEAGYQKAVDVMASRSRSA